MKKIVGILAAASVMAAAIFAADVSAGTKIAGTVFSYNDGGNEAIELFKEANDSHSYANPNIVFSISDDRAGATIKLTTDGGGDGLKVTQKEQTIWFKPFDFLKVTLGNYDIALNKETIDWTESFTGLGGEGYLVSVNAGAISVDLGLNPGAGNWWFQNTKDGDKRKTEIAQFFAKVGYSADFGNIGGYVLFNKKKPNSWEATVPYYYIDKPMHEVLTNMDFGVGYKNTFNPITMFVNVIGHMEDNFEWIRPEVFVNGNIEAFGFNVFAAPVIFTNQDLDKDFTLEILAKVTYRLDGITPFAYFKIPNAADKDGFVSTIKAGVSGNLGLMSYETWVQIDTGVGNDKDAVKISVPFWVSVNF